jgi:hypothetical protein
MGSGEFMIGVPFCLHQLAPIDREFADAAHLGSVL